MNAVMSTGTVWLSLQGLVFLGAVIGAILMRRRMGKAVFVMTVLASCLGVLFSIAVLFRGYFYFPYYGIILDYVHVMTCAVLVAGVLVGGIQKKAASLARRSGQKNRTTG